MEDNISIGDQVMRRIFILSAVLCLFVLGSSSVLAKGGGQGKGKKRWCRGRS